MRDENANPNAEAAEPRIPGPQRDDWIDFLHYIADTEMMSAAAETVIAVVEKPHNWTHEYAEYLALGGPDRS